MKLRNLFLLTILCIVGQFIVHAQNCSVKTMIDSASIKVGDPVHLLFEVSAPQNVQIRIPVAGEQLAKNIEVLKKIHVDSTDLSKRRWAMEVTSYDSGTHVIPSLPFVFINGNKIDTLFSDSLKLDVSLLPVDSTKVIADIKEPVSVPFTFKELAPYLVYGIGGLFVLFIIIWLIYRLRSKKSLLPNFKKPELPHEKALRELNLLKEEKLWQKGNVKEYYSRVSDIIRVYLEERFDIHALESTTAEISNQLQTSTQLSDYKQELLEILEMSDLAKFAKMQPDESSNIRCYELAVSFVEKTIPHTDNINVDQTKIE